MEPTLLISRATSFTCFARKHTIRHLPARGGGRHSSLMVKNEGSGSKPSRGCGWKLSLVNPADALDPMNHFEPIFAGH